MSRHRTVRSMDYNEEYDDYYSQSYGQSVEENYCVSPGTEAQFMYNRGRTRRDSTAFFNESDPDEELDVIPEERVRHDSFNIQSHPMDAVERAKLLSCVESLQNVVGDTIPESTLMQISVNNNYNSEAALNQILNQNRPTNSTLVSNSKADIKADSPKPERRTVNQPAEFNAHLAFTNESTCAAFVDTPSNTEYEEFDVDTLLNETLNDSSNLNNPLLASLANFSVDIDFDECDVDALLNAEASCEKPVHYSQNDTRLYKRLDCNVNSYDDDTVYAKQDLDGTCAATLSQMFVPEKSVDVNPDSVKKDSEHQVNINSMNNNNRNNSGSSLFKALNAKCANDYRILLSRRNLSVENLSFLNSPNVKFDYFNSSPDKISKSPSCTVLLTKSTVNEDNEMPSLINHVGRLAFGVDSAAPNRPTTEVAELKVPQRSRNKSPAAKADSRKTSPARPVAEAKSASKSSQKLLTQEDILLAYNRERGAGKTLINLVVVGHVDAGKSTLMGHLLYSLGQVTKKQMHRYETDAKKIGKASFMYAWVLDETAEERSRGITMDVAQSRFETNTKVVNLLDAPGHKDFIPNMITGASQADAALLVVDATNGEFEAGFEAGGQTREHALLIRSLGVSQLAVVVNKLDNVEWNEGRYNEIVGKLTTFLKQAGFKDQDVSFVPCSGLNGQNLVTKSDLTALTSWYKDSCLLDIIDSFKPPERLISKPFRLCVSDIFKSLGSGLGLSGKIEAGSAQIGQKVTVMPLGESCAIKAINIDDASMSLAFVGDYVTISLSGCDPTNITTGSLLCDATFPAPVTTRIEARILLFQNVIPLTKGFPVVFHYKSLNEQAVVTKLLQQLNKGTGQLIKKKPRVLNKNSCGLVEIEIGRPICVELYSEFKDLGRFMIRSSGSTIAAGLITKIL